MFDTGIWTWCAHAFARTCTICVVYLFWKVLSLVCLCTDVNVVIFCMYVSRSSLLALFRRWFHVFHAMEVFNSLFERTEVLRVHPQLQSRATTNNGNAANRMTEQTYWINNKAKRIQNVANVIVYAGERTMLLQIYTTYVFYTYAYVLLDLIMNDDNHTMVHYP